MGIEWKEFTSKNIRPSQPTERGEALVSREPLGEPFGGFVATGDVVGLLSLTDTGPLAW